jgi:hypothetical protein
MSTFRNYLHDSISELDRLYDHPAPDVEVWQRCATIATEAGDKAARLGFADLHRDSRNFAGMAEPMPVKTFLASCLAALPQASGELPQMLTADEAIAYLRLNIDGRDPHERLRNLIRRQRLPCIRRGKLMLFRRTSIDAWADARK